MLSTGDLCWQWQHSADASSRLDVYLFASHEQMKVKTVDTTESDTRVLILAKNYIIIFKGNDFPIEKWLVGVDSKLHEGKCLFIENNEKLHFSVNMYRTSLD